MSACVRAYAYAYGMVAKAKKPNQIGPFLFALSLSHSSSFLLSVGIHILLLECPKASGARTTGCANNAPSMSGRQARHPWSGEHAVQTKGRVQLHTDWRCKARVSRLRQRVIGDALVVGRSPEEPLSRTPAALMAFSSSFDGVRKCGKGWGQGRW